MAIRVECYAGYRGEQEPRAFWLGDRRLEALEILDRWVGPDYRYFRIKAGDGSTYILRHEESHAHNRARSMLNLGITALEVPSPASLPTEGGRRIASCMKELMLALTTQFFGRR
jgi:hypothetical protein